MDQFRGLHEALITPMDFYVWGHIKDLVYVTPVKSLEELRERENKCSRTNERKFFIKSDKNRSTEEVSGLAFVIEDIILSNMSNYSIIYQRQKGSALSPFNASSNNIDQNLLTVQNGLNLSEWQNLSKPIDNSELSTDSSIPLNDIINIPLKNEGREENEKGTEGKREEINKILYAHAAVEPKNVTQGVKSKHNKSMKNNKIGKDLKVKTTTYPNKNTIPHEAKPSIIEIMNKKLKLNATNVHNFDLPPSMIPIFKHRHNIEPNSIGNRELDLSFITAEPIIEQSNITTEANAGALNHNVNLTDNMLTVNNTLQNASKSPYIFYLSTNNINKDSNIKPITPELTTDLSNHENGITDPNYLTTKLNISQNTQVITNEGITNGNVDTNFRFVKFIPIGHLPNAGLMANTTNSNNGPNNNILSSNTVSQYQQNPIDLNIPKHNENTNANPNSNPKVATFNIPCHTASDVLNDVPVNSVPCASLTEANVDSVIKEISDNIQAQHLDEKVANLKNPDNSVAILFKTKDISLLKLYGDLLKKITITVLVPYHISKLGQDT
ncbi:putative uncharacterized protein DDB_G0282133 [Achroia grisella]|uniref:putative uncharacterized protein DDB_G0282133 n=1 Tax=Achroia grisella TaxID=688607 RepID=UPI0027D311A5|nr:putative uncharacterized protein DDB_G0282133 [Achroia grisella]